MKTKENLKSFSLIFSAVAFVAIATESNGNSSLEHFPADTVALSSSAIFATSTSPIAKPASSESKNTTNTSGLKHTDNSNLRSVVSHVSEKNSTLIGNNVTKSAVKSFSDSESKEIEEEARALGLLTSERLAQIIESEVQRRRQEAWEQLQALVAPIQAAFRAEFPNLSDDEAQDMINQWIEETTDEDAADSVEPQV